MSRSTDYAKEGLRVAYGSVITSTSRSLGLSPDGADCVVFLGILPTLCHISIYSGVQIGTCELLRQPDRMLDSNM